MKLFQSEQEKDIERRMKVKQGRRKVERFIRDQQKQAQRYWELARRACRLGDREVLKRLVSLIAQTRRSVNLWERRLLYFDMIEAQRDQAVAGADFAQAFEAMAQTILAHAEPAELARIQVNLERSLMVADELEDRLEDFQTSLDEMLEQAATAEEREELAEIMRMIQKEAEQEPEAVLDKEIEATMKQIEALLGKRE
jgi:hypothetical protein